MDIWDEVVSEFNNKINDLNNLVKNFSVVIIGGAMANTFLLANKINIGK